MQESNFIAKIEYSCRKKEALFDASKVKYALRSIYAGAFLTMTTAAGAIAADLVNTIHPALGRLVFPFVFAWGLVYILFLNAELTTSNMMYLTAGTFLKKIRWHKALVILLYCTLFNLVGALLAAWLFDHTSAFTVLTERSYLAGIAEHKLERANGLVMFEGILANLFVNVAIMSFLLLKDQAAKVAVVISAVYMFVFLTNEHLAANFASFSLVAFSRFAGQLEHFQLANILRHFSVTFVANWIGGGLLIGLAYAFLNRNEEHYVD